MNHRRQTTATDSRQLNVATNSRLANNPLGLIGSLLRELSGRTRSTFLHELLGRGLPVLPVEWTNLETGQVDAVNAAQIYDPPCWGDSRAAEGADATLFAEVVLGRHGAKLIDAEVGLPRQNAKVRIVGAVPEGTFHVANRAVALNGRANITVNFESDASTVTRALVCLHAGILSAV